jgi:hypothetical protein
LADAHTARLRVQEIRGRILDKHPQARNDETLANLFGSLERELLGMIEASNREGSDA